MQVMILTKQISFNEYITFGDIQIENIDYSKYKIGETVEYKALQKYKRGKEIEKK